MKAVGCDCLYKDKWLDCNLNCCRSIHIVALGSECPGGVGAGDETAGPGQVQGGLLWSYLGHGARELDPNSMTPSRHPLNPAFMEYQSRVFGDVRVMVRDCPSWVSNRVNERGMMEFKSRIRVSADTCKGVVSA